MWKPAGRLDCVDLEQGFFLTRFYLKEDYEAILQRGPWFIGEHFLSIRPWEPNFRPESTNVTSVAVWIRLNGLPIEYYNSEALLQIGKSIGNVLRVDTHTANEARGRFARLCVQIDVDKPLVTAVLIGRFEQPVCYEGIQKLCFSCGRMGHRKENCQYTVRPNSPAKEGRLVNDRDGEGQSCDMHVPHGPAEGMENNGLVHGNVAGASQDSTYGPWTVVARRKNVPKKQRSGGTQAVLDNGRLRHEQRKTEGEAKFKFTTGRRIATDGLGREYKRKLDTPKVLVQAQRASPSNGTGPSHSNVNHIPLPQKADGPASFLDHQVGSAASLNGVGSGAVKMGPFRSRGVEIDEKDAITEAQNSPSVKGKKVIARNKVRNKSINEGSGSNQTHFNLISLTPKILSRDETDIDPSTVFSFSTAANTEMGKLPAHETCGFFIRGDGGIEREDVAGEGMVRSPSEGRREDDGGAGKMGGLSTSAGPDVGIEELAASPQVHHGAGAATDFDGGEPGGEIMEFDEEGGANAFL